MIVQDFYKPKLTPDSEGVRKNPLGLEQGNGLELPSEIPNKPMAPFLFFHKEVDPKLLWKILQNPAQIMQEASLKMNRQSNRLEEKYSWNIKLCLVQALPVLLELGGFSKAQESIWCVQAGLSMRQHSPTEPWGGNH